MISQVQVRRTALTFVVSAQVVSGQGVMLVRDSDPAEYRDFITTARIAFTRTEMAEKKFAHFSQASTQSEVYNTCPMALLPLSHGMSNAFAIC
jgi:hypothetical protein